MGGAARRDGGLRCIHQRIAVTPHPRLTLSFTSLSPLTKGSSVFTSSVLDVPRPLVDPITSLVEALSVISLAMQRPRTSSTVVLALDKHRCGLHLFRMNSITPTSFHHIVRECSTIPFVDGVVVVSHRRTRPFSESDESLLFVGTRTLRAAGIHLIDWVVVGAGGMYCPRSLCGVPDPWPYGSTCM